MPGPPYAFPVTGSSKTPSRLMRGYVLYRCRFELAARAAGEDVRFAVRGRLLRCAGLAERDLSGRAEGYFSAFEFDVTDMLLVDGENELLVEVYSPEEREENDRKTIGGVWARWDGMAPHINPGGIFREVSSSSSGEIRMRSLGAAADGSGRGVAHVDLYASGEH